MPLFKQVSASIKAAYCCMGLNCTHFQTVRTITCNNAVNTASVKNVNCKFNVPLSHVLVQFLQPYNYFIYFYLPIIKLTAGTCNFWHFLILH